MQRATLQEGGEVAVLACGELHSSTWRKVEVALSHCGKGLWLKEGTEQGVEERGGGGVGMGSGRGRSV